MVRTRFATLVPVIFALAAAAACSSDPIDAIERPLPDPPPPPPPPHLRPAPPISVLPLPPRPAPCPGQEIACGGRCCPEGVGCVDGLCELPDLVVDEESLRQSLRFDQGNFAGDDCALEEACVQGSGLRRLLRFTLAVNNIGGADLVVGDPDSSPYKYWSECHGHYHMAEFTTYRLIDADGNIVADGHKQAFCLRDTQRLDPSIPDTPRYTCEDQGISKGWSDSYGSDLDCQWVDITGVPAGEYLLEVIVNEQGVYPDLDLGNNRVTVPVEIPADPSVCIPQPEICDDGLDQSCAGEPDSGCLPITGIGRCEDALHIGGSGVWTAALEGDPEEDPPSCGGQGASVVFRIEILRDEIIFLSTHGSTLDTVLSITEAPCGGTEVACSAGSCGTGQSQFAGQLPYGMHYVRITAADPGVSGIVRLRVERSRCKDATPILAPGRYDGATAGAGNTMTSCGLGHGPEDLWYFTTCPGETLVEIDTCGDTDFNTVLELRQGSCRGPAVACNDDVDPACAESPRASAIRQKIEGEGLWFLLVDGYASDSIGSYQLNVSF